jgi:hypothetical protein
VCPAASHLPQLDRGAWHPPYLGRPGLTDPFPDGWTLLEPTEQDMFAADWGTAMHAAIAGEPDAQDPWATIVAPHVEKFWPRRLGEHEVAVSWDCRAKSLEIFRAPTEAERTQWKMTRGPDCVVGTCDWWARLPSGEPWVDDLGTGWQAKDPLSPQNLFYLMCRVRAPDCEGWPVGRSSITWWPRKSCTPEDPSVPTREGLWRQLTALQLDAFEEELHVAWVRAVGFDPQPRPGAHCTRCPSAQVCPRANE